MNATERYHVCQACGVEYRDRNNVQVVKAAHRREYPGHGFKAVDRKVKSS